MKNEMGRGWGLMWHVMGRGQVRKKGCSWGNLKERENLEDLGGNDGVILK